MSNPMSLPNVLKTLPVIDFSIAKSAIFGGVFPISL
jgi:hypothetical protein